MGGLEVIIVPTGVHQLEPGRNISYRVHGFFADLPWHHNGKKARNMRRSSNDLEWDARSRP